MTTYLSLLVRDIRWEILLKTEPIYLVSLRTNAPELAEIWTDTNLIRLYGEHWLPILEQVWAEKPTGELETRTGLALACFGRIKLPLSTDHLLAMIRLAISNQDLITVKLILARCPNLNFNTLIRLFDLDWTDLELTTVIQPALTVGRAKISDFYSRSVRYPEARPRIERVCFQVEAERLLIHLTTTNPTEYQVYEHLDVSLTSAQKRKIFHQAYSYADWELIKYLLLRFQPSGELEDQQLMIVEFFLKLVSTNPIKYQTYEHLDERLTLAQKRTIFTKTCRQGNSTLIKYLVTRFIGLGGPEEDTQAMIKRFLLYLINHGGQEYSFHAHLDVWLTSPQKHKLLKKAYENRNSKLVQFLFSRFVRCHSGEERTEDERAMIERFLCYLVSVDLPEYQAYASLDVCLTGAQRRSILSTAAQEGNVPLMEYLLKRFVGDYTRADLNSVVEKAKTCFLPLLFSAGATDVFEALLQAQKNRDSKRIDLLRELHHQVLAQLPH